MTTVDRGTAARPGAEGSASRRIPFPTVDEISRHCLQDEDPETVHIEAHLPARPDPGRLRAAFHQALLRHPRILVRQAPSAWWRRRYEWEQTGEPDTDPVAFPPRGADALVRARERALADCPPLSASPPVRLDVVTGADGTGGGCILLLTINHTALDGPACLRVLATAAELYGGRDNSPARAAPPAPRRAKPAPGPAPEPASGRRGRGRPVRVAASTAAPAHGNGMLLAELPVPGRPHRDSGGGAPYTVNDQLLVATRLMVARWNLLRAAPTRPVRITMPVDDRTRGSDMPIGNGTRLVDVGFGADEPLDEAALTAERPDPAAVARLLRRTAARTRTLKSTSGPQLGLGETLLTAPVLPVGVRAAVTRGLRRAAAPWASTTLLSNIGRLPYPLDFGDAGRADAVWFSAPARMPRGLTVTTASTGGRLHVALRWSRALLDDAAGAELAEIFTRALDATSATPAHPTDSTGSIDPTNSTDPTDTTDTTDPTDLRRPKEGT
ncbi:condensation protein [Streptomyces sp. NPDC050610]|uniref:condensation protein n=1 Tax=Streptomyces sp. NPDC050610 TaxID=3157097 RepID=UPI003429BCA1